jgi:hypothetical protein
MKGKGILTRLWILTQVSEFMCGLIKRIRFYLQKLESPRSHTERGNEGTIVTAVAARDAF